MAGYRPCTPYPQGDRLARKRHKNAANPKRPEGYRASPPPKLAFRSIDALGRTITAMPEMLVVRGLSDLWEPGAIGPRYAMGMSETWMFQTGGRGKVNELQSMVSLIRFSVEKPKDLEIHLIDRKIIQTWPGAALMLRIWDECFQG